MGRDMVVLRYAIPQVFRALTGCQRDPRVFGTSQLDIRASVYEYLEL